MEILIVLTLLVTKHCIVDFPLQTRFQYSNKGTYGHPGGILHAGMHGIGTYLCLFAFTPIAVWMAFVDAVVHYHIDWAKMNLNSRLGWGANTHEQFWWLLGLDQYLHYITYIGLTAWVFGVIS
jgi:hypothetical protein